MELPSPAEPALAASARLVERIGARIAAAGGWIGFDEFMRAALYEPGLGYYAGGSRKFGAQGDFVTAPELSPLFGACVARQCAQWFGHVPARIWEFGAGTGALAAQVLAELEHLGVTDVDYAIVELSGELRERQRSTIEAATPRAAERVRWLDAWPASMAGVVLANELLDAMPARAFRWHRGEVLERGVRARGAGASDPVGAGGEAGSAELARAAPAPRAQSAAPAPRAPSAAPAPRAPSAAFEWAVRPADADFARRVRAALAGPIEDAGGDWPDTYDGELGEQALAWVADAGRRLERGALLLVDYGFPAHEFYHPQRGAGTLMCHYRHRAHGDPFLWPGLQDITVHVDFTALALAAQDAGLDVLGYTSQAAALLNLGLLERFEREAGDDALARARRAQSLHVLIGDAEMGELFKFIALGRALPDDAIAFARADRRHRL